MTTPIPRPNVVVYTDQPLVTADSLTTLQNWVNSLPDGQQKTMLENDLKNTTLVSDVADCGFPTVIVGLWHVHDDGSIYYNDFPYDSNTSAAFNEAISALKSSYVETVLISFGGGGPSDSDYAAMQAHWTTFKPQLIELLKNINADGVDWDYEPAETFNTGFITQITNELGADYLVTAAPYDDSSASNWTTVLQGTASPGNNYANNKFSWWNLQLYGPNTDYSNWVTALNGVAGFPGNQIEAFLAPGFSISGNDDSDAMLALASLYNTYPSLGGCFVWNYGSMGPTNASQVVDDIMNVFQ